VKSDSARRNTYPLRSQVPARTLAALQSFAPGEKLVCPGAEQKLVEASAGRHGEHAARALNCIIAVGRLSREKGNDHMRWTVKHGDILDEPAASAGPSSFATATRFKRNYDRASRSGVRISSVKVVRSLRDRLLISCAALRSPE
jgi:hypothetical protein